MRLSFLSRGASTNGTLLNRAPLKVNPLPRCLERVLAPASKVNRRAARWPLNVAAPDAPSVEKEPIKLPELVKVEGPLVGEDGIPLVYDKKLLEEYWNKRPGQMQQRWTFFLSLSVPFISRLVRDYTAGTLVQNEVEIAERARINMEKLGPTFIKLGQTVSVRPDVLSDAVRGELQKLQNNVEIFPTELAREIIEAELGQPLDEIFSEISEEPVAAASLAQVYKARLRSSGEYVAVKVQRPAALETISRDLYVMQRAAVVYQQLVDRWTVQKTDYVELLDTWAEGFYQELDFEREARNQARFGDIVEDMDGIYVPKVYMEYSSRRLLVTEWVEGTKLTQSSPEEIQRLIKIGKECYLKQLLEVGFFHCDPHPGNLLKMTDESKGQLCIIDFGLVTEVPEDVRDVMVRATIHLANRDFSQLIDDFVELGFLPTNIDRNKVAPLMKTILEPYVVQGGGAKGFIENGNFQQMTKDMISATVEIPFAIPPYFSLLGRAIVSLEGIALVGDPDYRMVMESYPYIARRLLRDNKASMNLALTEILYSKDGKFRPQRLSVLLNSALDNAANSSAFVDFDSMPEDSASLERIIELLLSEDGAGVRQTLIQELSMALDLVLRQAGRRFSDQVLSVLAPPTPPFPVPSFLVPPNPFNFPPIKTAQTQILDAFAPTLTPEEEVYVRSLFDLTATLAGVDPKVVENLTPEALLKLATQPPGQNDGSSFSELRDVAGLLGSSSEQGERLREMGTSIFENVAQMYNQRLNEFVQRAAR
ncbi:hypothetical protein BSKO_09308 [Bryopsis sp. KO-2023]|nr:hypothetical protein BSKO_09308 [Bryopsis sp. KO-2023]